ncbi:MAG TPA: neuraminidase-like domain-containing protein [Polyangiaceae bacterium]
MAEIAQAHPEQPNADAVALATVLSTLMNAANVGTALAIVESPEATQKNLDFVTRHLAKIVGAAASFLSDLAARPLAERYSRVFGQIRAHLVDQARTNAVIQIASDLMGIDADTANSYLTRALSGLSSPPPVAPLTEYPNALAQWKAFLLGGWNTGEAVIVDRPSGTRRTRVVIQRGGLYRFVASVNATAGVSNSQFVLLVDGVPRKFAGTTTTADGRTEVAFAPLTLRAGDIIAVRFGYTGSAQVSLLWQIDTDDPVPVPATAGVPLDDRAYTKLFKASRLVKGLGMTKVELEWLLDRPNADETVPDLDLLPYDEDEPRVAWSRLARLIEVVGLNRSVRMKDQTLFEFWRDLAPGLPEYDDDSEDEGVTLVSSQTEWRIDDIEAVLGLFSDVPAWDDPALWFALRDAFRVVRRLDIRANLIRDLLVTRAPNLRRAVSLRNAVRSQFSKDAWKEAFKPLRDPLRRRQRDALVGYLTSRTITLADKPFDFFDANDLFAHFLIDVEMEPDTLLSRVKLALNAIQLFVHRVFFGLEPAQVFANPPEAKRQWAWMERYRVWEANRKVFLYPENWIEPELRDDKSEFFLELEAQLEQGKLSGESAQIALADYLEKLRDVSNLEIIGAFAERTFSIGTNQVLHIVGRSRSRTRTFYYRTFTAKQSHDGSFTPWKEIKLEINADVVAPVVWNGRLHLFWPKIITKEKPQPGGAPADDASAEYQSEIQIMWSEYIPKKNKWSKARIGKTRLTDYNAPSPFQRDIGDDQARTENYHIRASLEPDHISITLFRTDVPTGPTQTVWRAERLQREVRNWFGQVRIEEYVDNVPHQVPSSLNLMELGVFHVWQSGEDTVEPSGLDWSKAGIGNNHPRGTVLKSNASIEVEFAVEEELANDALKFQGFVQFLARTPDLFRVFAPNLGSFVDNKLLEPFFFETPLKSTFALPQPSPYAPSFFFGFFNFATATRFSTFHHPLVQDFERIHNEYGTEGLMTRLTQALPLVDGRYYSNYYYNYYGQLYLGYHIAGDTQAWGTTQRMFETEHEPNTVTVIPPYPLPTVEFGYGTSFGVYNWELFFHLPMLVGGLLSQDLQFEEAMKWYHYVFDPKQTLNDYERTKEWVSALPAGARFWNFLPFFANKQTTDSLAETLGFNATAAEHEKNELTAVLDEWRNNPFKPHLIARHRMSAYQKFVVMKYLDNLIAWGDSLFRQDTFETINEATQLYVIAEEILGQRPEQVEPLTGSPRHTYRELSALGFGPLSNAVTEVESLVVSSKPHLRSHQSVVRTSGMRALSGVAIQSLFFRIPRNEKLDQYWEVVQDRLFKIRNSMNIDGVKRQLALFEPPIDPALLVRAVAAGLDIGSVLAQLGAPLPCYRFSTWIQRAVDVANELRGFGGAFLAALEKKDAEELQQLRQTHEIRMLELVRVVRRQQVAEAESNIEALEASRAIAEERQAEYRRRSKISRGELAQIDRTKAATAWDVKAGSLHALAAAFSSVPDSTIGTNGLEFATRSHFKIGAALQGAASAHAHGAGTFASLARGEAALAALTAGFDRRWEDWKLQERLAQKEVAQINQQLAVARIRLSIAEKELDNHETAIEQAEEMLEFLKDKFTSKDLYQWMVRELSRSYQKVYKLAYDAAKTAERTFQFELGVEDPAFVQFDYRDSLREGLLAGEKLIVDLKRLEHAYLERNKRELEIQKSVSLAQLNGEALQKLRETGTCTFDLSEVLFDLDFPGHYFRRVKAVRLTIPCVTGPHTSVSAKLTLLSSVFRKEATLATPEEYPFTGVDDPRFAHNPIGIQSIATGTAQGDAGLFTLDFRDERYLPFEGGGVVSRWRLELPADPRQFDYATISDVVIQLSYTARDGGDVLKQGAVQSLTEGEVPGLNRIREFVTAPPEETAPLGLVRVFSLRKDFPDAFQRLLVTEGEPGVELTLLPEHFPFVLRDAGLPLALTDGSETETQEIGVHIVAKLAPATGAPEPTLTGATLSVTAEGGAAAPVTLTDPTEGSVIEESIDIGDSALVPEWSEQRFKLIQQGLSPTNVDDIVLVAKYAVSATG